MNTFRLLDTDEIRAQVRLTLTIAQWKKIRENILKAKPEYDRALNDLLDDIAATVATIEATYQAPEKGEP